MLFRSQMNVSCKGGGSTTSNDGGERHSGSTIYSFDDQNDGDVDLLLGDISFNNVVYVQNCGDSSYATVCAWDSSYPSCGKPIILPYFPGVYGAHIDTDALEDLLVAPNARNGGMDINNVMYYHNNGNPACMFDYITDTFLVNQHFDFGTDSKPVFFD